MTVLREGLAQGQRSTLTQSAGCVVMAMQINGRLMACLMMRGERERSYRAGAEGRSMELIDEVQKTSGRIQQPLEAGTAHLGGDLTRVSQRSYAQGDNMWALVLLLLLFVFIAASITHPPCHRRSPSSSSRS